MSLIIKNAYERTANLLKTLDWVKSVDLYYMQDTSSEKALPYHAPYIMIDFQNITIAQTSNGLQQYTMDMNIKIMVETYTRNQLEVFTYADNVTYLMYNFNPIQFSIRHDRESLDTDATNMYVYQITYQVNFYQDFSYIYASTSGIGFDIGVSMDSNNDGVYTGFAS